MATIVAARPAAAPSVPRQRRAWVEQLVSALTLALAARLAYSLYAAWRLIGLAQPYSPVHNGN